MKLEADLHTHTIASGHAYSTLNEMVATAREKGLKMLAITDHDNRMPGGPDLEYFFNMAIWPREIQGVTVLRGVETNIVDDVRGIDLPEELLDRMDIVLAGFHADVGYLGHSVEENTRAMVAALRNPKVHIITHPGNPRFPVDLKKVVLAAKEYGKVLEINNSSFLVRPNSAPRCLELARLARRYGVPVAINSDAHICFQVGDCSEAVQLAVQAGIEEDAVLNSSAVRVRDYLARHGKVI